MNFSQIKVSNDITIKEELQDLSSKFDDKIKNINVGIISSDFNLFDKSKRLMCGIPDVNDSSTKINEVSKSSTYRTCYAIETKNVNALYLNQKPCRYFVFKKDGTILTGSTQTGLSTLAHCYMTKPYGIQLSNYSYVEFVWYNSKVGTSYTSPEFCPETLMISRQEISSDEYIPYNETIVKLGDTQVQTKNEYPFVLNNKVVNIFDKGKILSAGMPGDINSYLSDNIKNAYQYTTCPINIENISSDNNTMYFNYRPRQVAFYNQYGIRQNFTMTTFKQDSETSCYYGTLEAIPNHSFIRICFDKYTNDERYVNPEKFVVSFSKLSSSDYIPYIENHALIFDKKVLVEDDIEALNNRIINSPEQYGNNYVVFIGERSGSNNTLSNGDYGKYNVAIGPMAMGANISGNHNVATGYRALYSNKYGSFNTAIGHEASFGLSSGENNVNVGLYSGWNLKKADDNIIIGAYSGYQLSTENSNNNIIIGTHGMQYSKHSNDTIAIGSNSNFDNNISSSTDNIFIGHRIKTTSELTDKNFENCIVIGNKQTISSDNTTIIGNSETLNTIVYGDLIVNGSDGIKKKIVFNSDYTISWEPINT